MTPESTQAAARHDLLSVGGGFLVLLAASAVVAFFMHSKASAHAIRQPLAFNHAKHVVEAQMECSACHTQFATETSSGVPGARTCKLCHSEAQGESANEAELVARLAAGDALEWVPVFRQPPHVFFSHRRHVVVAKLECTQCHGDIGASSAPPDRTLPLKMAQCLDCHAAQQVSTDCSDCHR